MTLKVTRSLGNIVLTVSILESQPGQVIGVIPSKDLLVIGDAVCTCQNGVVRWKSH